VLAWERLPRFRPRDQVPHSEDDLQIAILVKIGFRESLAGSLALLPLPLYLMSAGGRSS
jgi:hypothetical protein